MGGKGGGSDFKEEKQNRGEEEKHVHFDGERNGEKKHSPEPLLIGKEQTREKSRRKGEWHKERYTGSIRTDSLNSRR